MLYNIKNSNVGNLEIVDSSGNTKTVMQGTSLQADLTPAVYLQLVGILGSANVTPIPTNNFHYAGLALTPVATPTDVILIQGSASAVVRVKSIKLSGAATAQGAIPVQLVRRSAAPTLGSAALTAITAGKLDTTGAAATAVVSTVGTANITTLGTAVATLQATRLGLPALSTGAAGDGQTVVWDFNSDPTDNLILRGTSDYLCINFNGATVPAGGVIDYVIDTAESAS